MNKRQKKKYLQKINESCFARKKQRRLGKKNGIHIGQIGGEDDGDVATFETESLKSIKGA